MKLKNKIAVLITLVLLVSAGFWLVLKPATPRYIFLLTLDTTRADHISYEPGNQKTPNLAEIAAMGVRFDEAFTPIPITLPAHMALFYAQAPHQVHVYNNGQIQQIGQGNLTQILKNDGYSTAAVISLGVLKKEFGLAKGFDEYNDTFKDKIWFRTAEQVNEAAWPMISGRKGSKSFFWLHYSDPHDPYLPPSYSLPVTLSHNQEIKMESNLSQIQHIDQILTLSPGINEISFSIGFPDELADGRGELLLTHFSWGEETSADLDIQYNPDQSPLVQEKLDHQKQKRFFVKDRLVIHVRHQGPSPIDVKMSCDLGLEWKNPGQLRKLYGEEISYMDAQIGRLIDFLKSRDMLEESLFVIVGDHGEGLGEFRGHVGHIHHLNRPYMHVPLIISGCGVKDRGAVSRRVSTLEITPTILDLLGLEKTEFMRPSSLFSNASKDEGPLLFETYTPEAFFDSFSLLLGPLQLIYVPKRPASPFELYNWDLDSRGIRNLADDPAHKADKLKSLARLRDMANLIMKNRKRGNHPSRKVEEMLKTLGYL